MDHSDLIKQLLLKEASVATSCQTTPSDTPYNNHIMTVKAMMLQESNDKLHRFKIAELDKEGMAAQIGVKDIRNSTANTIFDMPQFSDEQDSMENKLYEAYKNFFYTRIDGKQVDINAGIFIPETKAKYKHEPQSHLRIEFPFRRSIMPSNKEFAAKSTQAVKVVEKIIPGFQQFITALEQNNVPVLPYFHTTVRSPSKGGVNDAEAHQFISREVGKPLTMPNGQPIQFSDRFYKEHVQRIQNGDQARLTHQHPHDRRYDREHVFSINVPAVLLNAIANKVQQGYWIDWRALKQDLKGRIDRMSKLNKDADTEVKKQVYTDYYRKFYQSMADAFTNAQHSMRSNDVDSHHNWGQMKGLKVRNKGNKHVEPEDLSTLHLKLALYHMTVHLPKKATTQVTVKPNEFTIPGHKLTYSSNGLDSNPSDPSRQMLLFPAMRKSRGQIGYDTDQCNMGRTQLVHNGSGIGNLLASKFGSWCEQSLRKLQQTVKDTQLKRSSPAVFDAIQKVFLNRTNAEATLGFLGKFNDYAKFRSDFLGQSIASQYTGGRKLKDTINTQDSTIGPDSFPLLRQYGYQMAKMMDFVSCVAHRSCEETITSREDDGETVKEKFYGRTLATATGKAGKSSIIIGIRYANSAPMLASNDPQMKAIVDKERQKSRVNPGGTDQDYLRMTKNPVRGTPLPQQFQTDDVWKIVYDLRFFVGLATSDSNFQKAIGSDDYEDWGQALNVLLTRYPQIETELGVIIEPMNANLREMSSRFKKAMTRIQKEISKQKKTDFVIVDQENHTQEILSSEAAGNVTDIEGPVEQMPPTGQMTGGPMRQSPVQPGGVATMPPTAIKQPNVAPQQGVVPPSQQQKFVGRRDTSKRNLVKQRPSDGKLKRSEAIDVLIKTANRLDEAGFYTLANKIDLLNRLITKDNDAS